ncbi:hypothetical protein PUR23_27225 [Methylorubrum populi]|uniref:hypothetical protein n=1 Tax=Methylorubrum populi TaxID=223967 RepID=UPI0031F92BBB
MRDGPQGPGGVERAHARHDRHAEAGADPVLVQRGERQHEEDLGPARQGCRRAVEQALELRRRAVGDQGGRAPAGRRGRAGRVPGVGQDGGRALDAREGGGGQQRRVVSGRIVREEPIDHGGILSGCGPLELPSLRKAELYQW